MKNLKKERRTHSHFSYLFILCSAATLTPGCSTIKFGVPAARFDSPEVNGAFKEYRIDAGLAGTQTILLTDDFTTTQPNTQRPKITTGNLTMPVNLSFGFEERIDLELKPSVDFAPGLVQMKYQILGATRKERAFNSFALAATGGLGGGMSLNNKGSNDRFATYGIMGDTALIVGYRLNPSFLTYGGGYYRTLGYNGTYQYGSPLTSGTFRGALHQLGANFGISLDFERVSLKTEVTRTYLTAGESKSATTFIGMMLSFYLH